MNFRAPARILGRLTLLVAGAQLIPGVCSMFYGEWEVVIAFLIASLVTAIFGGLLMALGRNAGEIYRREGILIVVGGWVFASLFGALPYLIAGTFLSPVDALFESASGFTTTGASVMTVIETHSKGILFWRSFTQWLGGMGIIVLFVALLPELGPGARFLYKLEVPGPTAEALVPRIHNTAAVLWKIYLVISGIEAALLMLAGMNLYDSLTHTFSTMSTGGFSPYNTSVAAFDNPMVHIIIIVFMVLAGTNFSLFFGLRLLSGWRFVWRDTEFRLYLAILGGTALILVADLLHNSIYDNPGRALLDSVFQAVSITTTTGFATADFDGWPVLSKMLIVGLMFVGGCAGSTAGSMKVMRMVIGLRSAFRETKLIFSPNTVLSVFVGGKAVPNSVVRAVAGFFILYLSTWALGTIALSLNGPDLVTCATASAATIGNIGPGLNAVGPAQNFAFWGSADKLLMIMLMWMGRLEIYAIAALFSRAFWRA